jgi:hypothetical protein
MPPPRICQLGVCDGFARALHHGKHALVLATSCMVFSDTACICCCDIPRLLHSFPGGEALRDAVFSCLLEVCRWHRDRGECRRRTMESLLEDFARKSDISSLSEGTVLVQAELASFFDVAHRLRTQLTRVIDAPQAFGRIAELGRDKSFVRDL